MAEIIIREKDINMAKRLAKPITIRQNDLEEIEKGIRAAVIEIVKQTFFEYAKLYKGEQSFKEKEWKRFEKILKRNL